MKKLMLIAVGATLMASAPLVVSAQSNHSMGPSGPQQSGPPGDRHGADHGPGPGMGNNGPGMGNNGPGRGDDHGMGHDDYGRWDDHWGSRPPPPPKQYSRHGNWYQHVRSCQTRYRSYNSRTDMYVVRRGVMARCRL